MAAKIEAESQREAAVAAKLEAERQRDAAVVVSRVEKATTTATERKAEQGIGEVGEGVVREKEVWGEEATVVALREEIKELVVQRDCLLRKKQQRYQEQVACVHVCMCACVCVCLCVYVPCV